MVQTFSVGARSRLVTATAWGFIALGLLAPLSALLRRATPLSVAGETGLASLPRFVGDLPWAAAASLVVAVAMLAAVGLLRRREWARRTVIGLLAVAVVAGLPGLWLLQAVMLHGVDATLQRAVLAPPVAGLFGDFVVAVRAMALLGTLTACALLAWVAWRLTLPPIRQEFR